MWNQIITVTQAMATTFPYAYSIAVCLFYYLRKICKLTSRVQANDTDWIHLTFTEAWTQQQRLQNLDGVQREHSLYGPQTIACHGYIPLFTDS